MIRNYFKTAFRNLFRNKIYSFINITGLSLGLACAMLIILYIKDEVSYDRFHKNLGQIYHIVSQDVGPDGKPGSKDANTGYLPGPAFTRQIPEIESFVRIQGNRGDIRLGQEIKSVDFLYVDSNFFSVFTFPLLSGNPHTALLDPHSVVLSEDEARREFGTARALGRTVTFIENEKPVPYTVTGVARRCPQNSSIKFDILRPMQVDKDALANSESWFNFFLNTFVKLAPDADISRVDSKMQKVYESDAAEAIKLVKAKYGVQGSTDYYLQAFTDMHLSKDLPAQNGLKDASNPMYSYILSGIALFILLIACINFVNLTVARSIKRAKEIGIRKVIGGERRQLIGQFLGESYLLCLLAFLLALLLVQVSLPVFNRLSNKALSLSYLLDAKLVIGYIGLFLITGLLAGFYPALVLSHFNPVQTLYRRFMLAGKNYLQKSLVVLQFSLASFLIVGTLTLFAQFNYLTTINLGYNDNNLVVVNKANLGREEAQRFREELLKSPDILGVSARNGGYWITDAKVNGETKMDFAYATIDPKFLPLLNIPVVQGRNFSDSFPSDSIHSVLVNEAFVRQAGWKNPLGQTVDFWYNKEKYSVVGVVRDYHFRPLNEKIGPQLFTMKRGNHYGRMLIKIRPNSATASLGLIGKTFKQFFPISPYSYEFQDDINRKNYEAEAKWKQILLFGAVLTIFISCIGLFGLSVLSAERRIKEIGIRKVLGASVSGVVSILSRDFLKLVILALLIAMPVAWWVSNHWLENYPYRINLNVWIFISTAGAVLLVAGLTVSFQAIRAAMANPVKSLRNE